MKLLRVGPKNQEKPAVLDDQNRIRDISSLVRDIEGEYLSENSLEALAKTNLSQLPVLSSELRIGPCVSKVGKFICIGQNYSDRVTETGIQLPKEPIVFMKATSSITGPYDKIIKPKYSKRLDWEVEFGIVIGAETTYVNEIDAEKHIAGYCLINDISERAFQIEHQGQWCKGKSCDTFGPIGPWLVTKEEVVDITQLHMWLEVNGKRYQSGNTKYMRFKPNFIVSYLSQFMSLQPGDIISTGTPSGVGMSQTPPIFLNNGDSVKLGIEGLGEQLLSVVNYCPTSKNK